MAYAHGLMLLVVVMIASTVWGGSPLPAVLALCLPLSLRARLFMVLAALLLWFCVALAVHSQQRQLLPHSLSGVPLTVSGHLVGLPQCDPARFTNDRHPVERAAFDLAVDSVADWPGAHRLRLSWYLPHGQCASLEPGQALRLQLRLHRPADGDATLHALRHGISAWGTVVTGQMRQSSALQPSGHVDRWRLALSARLEDAAAGYPHAQALLPALVSGDRRGLDQSTRQTLAATGTAHLVAISGLHISLVVFFVTVLIRRPLTLLARHWAMARHGIVLLALCAAVLYAAMAGFAVATSRALAMAALLTLLTQSGRRLPAFTLLWLALVLLLLVDPLMATSPGLWMSVAAVYLLMLFGRRGTSAMHGQWLLTVVLSPLAAWWFSPPGMGAWLANLLLVPLFALVIIPLSLLAAMLDPFLLLVPLLGQLLDLVWPGLVAMAAWPVVPVPPSLMMALAWAAGWLLLGLRGVGLPRWPLMIVLLPLCLPFWQRPMAGEFALHVFDVGQGSAQAVVTRNHVLLFDSGPGGQGSDAAQRRLLPWLRRQPQSLVHVFVSHGDDDHVGGLASLRPALGAARLWSGEPERVAGARPCRRGQGWQLDGVRFDVLWPPDNVALLHSNNRSCVLRVAGDSRSLMLSGDITRAVEYALVASGMPPSDIVQVPHHGSHSSSSFGWIRAARPQVVYTSTGRFNPFGHPDAAVVARYRAMGAPVFDTGAQGDLLWLPQTPLAAPRSSLDQQWRSPWRWVSPVVE